MDFFFFFIFLISFILLILGLIKPAIGLFWNKQRASRQKVLLIYGIAIVCSFIGIGVFAQPSAPRSKEPAEKTVQKDAPRVYTEDELVMLYETKWETVNLTHNGDFPNYADYVDSLNSVLNGMKNQTSARSLPKLEKLYKQYSTSKKLKEAAGNFITYGQPEEYELTYACEKYLEETAVDPSSLKIEKRKIEGRTKTGWEVWLKYSATNSFGARISQVSKFDVRHSAQETFYVHHAY